MDGACVEQSQLRWRLVRVRAPGDHGRAEPDTPAGTDANADTAQAHADARTDDHANAAADAESDAAAHASAAAEPPPDSAADRDPQTRPVPDTVARADAKANADARPIGSTDGPGTAGRDCHAPARVWIRDASALR